MDAVKQLNYAPRPPKSHRRLRRFHQFAVVCSLIAAGYFWGPGAWRWAKYLNWQYQAARYLASPDHIAFEETPAGILTADAPFSLQPGTFFLHQLRRPDGILRLVAISGRAWCVHAPAGSPMLVTIPGNARQLPVPAGASVLLNIQKYIVLPIGFKINPAIVLQSSTLALPPASKDCRYFAGQPDPVDPSHFTFVYESDGKKYPIDCWLKNDDRLVVSPRP